MTQGMVTQFDATLPTLRDSQHSGNEFTKTISNSTTKDLHEQHCTQSQFTITACEYLNRAPPEYETPLNSILQTHSRCLVAFNINACEDFNHAITNTYSLKHSDL